MGRDDPQVTVTRSDVLMLQVLHVAMPLGVLTFALVIAGMAFLGVGVDDSQWSGEPPPVPEDAVSLLQTLSLAHMGLCAAALGLCLALPRLFLAPRAGADEHPRAALGRVRAAFLVRLIVVEGAALFGLTVCLIGAVRGALADHPVYWLNAASGLVLVAVAVLAFPTRRGIEEQLARALGR